MIVLILLCFFSLITTSVRSDQDFDALLKQVVTEKETQWQIYEGEIERIDAKFNRIWQERKAEIEQKWDKALRSTNKEWVKYSPSLDVRSYVNFDEGFVEVTAILPVKDKDIAPKAEELISNQIKKVFAIDNDSGQNLLKDQVVHKPGRTVTHDTVSLFIDKIKKKVEIADKPFFPKDNVPRVKVKVRFELLPNHLQIRAKKFQKLIDMFSTKFGVLPELTMAVIHTESYFNPVAVSPANAHGLMQLIPKYGARDAYRMVYKRDRIVSPNYLYAPENNIELGSAYLSILKDKGFKRIQGDTKRLYLAICAYNWGPGSIKRKIINKYDIEHMTSPQLYQTLRKQAPKETSDYLQRVTKRMKLYATIYQK